MVKQAAITQDRERRVDKTRRQPGSLLSGHTWLVTNTSTGIQYYSHLVLHNLVQIPNLKVGFDASLMKSFKDDLRYESPLYREESGLNLARSSRKAETTCPFDYRRSGVLIF